MHWNLRHNYLKRSFSGSNMKLLNNLIILYVKEIRKHSFLKRYTPKLGVLFDSKEIHAEHLRPCRSVAMVCVCYIQFINLVSAG